MEYSTGTSHLLSAILTRASRKSTWAFAQDTLGRPTGISFARWAHDIVEPVARGARQVR
jgi:CubicO group peptidase (beta-lactamase class C family)